MKKSLEIIGYSAYYPVIPGLMLAGMIFLTGCEPSSPGAGATMGPPGAPISGGRVPGAPNPGSHFASPARQMKKSIAVSAVADKGQKPADVPAAGNQPPGIPTGMPVAGIESPNPAKSNGDNKAKQGDPASPDSAVNPMAPLSKVQQAGNTVELASEIIVAGANPFLDRLPKPIVAVTSMPGTDQGGENATPAPAVAPPADPLDSISVLGIAYQAKSPMALLAMSGADAKTQMVRKGDVLTVEAGQVKVADIGPASVELQSLGAKQDKRTLSLPSIIGYAPSAAAGGKASVAEKPSDMMSGQADKAGSPISELQKVMRVPSMGTPPSAPAPSSNSEPKAPSGVPKGPNLSLKEP